MPPQVQIVVGLRVQVDISGLLAPGVSVGSGVSASGTITHIDAIRRLVTVQLDVSFSGQNVVIVPPEKIAVAV
jgi:hypothetical protein